MRSSRPSRWRGWQCIGCSRARRSTWHGAPGTSALVGVLLAAPAVLSLVPYLMVQQEMGLRRALGDYPPANAASFLASPTYVHRFVLGLFDATSINETARAFLFPGYVPIVLSLAAFLPWLRPSRDARSGCSTCWSHW